MTTCDSGKHKIDKQNCNRTTKTDKIQILELGKLVCGCPSRVVAVTLVPLTFFVCSQNSGCSSHFIVEETEA